MSDKRPGEEPAVDVQVQVQDKPEQGECPMAMEQVNVQELQRLNDAITLTFDAIRRVAPQLSVLQQQLAFGGAYGMGMHPMQQIGNPWLSQAYGVSLGGMHAMPFAQQPWYAQPFGVSPWQQYGVGQQYGIGQQVPFGGQQVPFGGQQVPFGGQQVPFGGQAPFGASFGQRIF